MDSLPNNGVVSVTFDNKAERIYDYYVPTYISPNEIQNYVIVDNVFYDEYKDVSPYKIVKVLDYYPKDSRVTHMATKYIAGAINSMKYIEIRQKQQMSKMLDEKIENLLNHLDNDAKIAILAKYDPDYVKFNPYDYYWCHCE